MLFCALLLVNEVVDEINSYKMEGILSDESVNQELDNAFSRLSSKDEVILALERFFSF